MLSEYLKRFLLLVHTGWFFLFQFCFRNCIVSSPSKRTQLHHGVILIGDGTADGFGDYITIHSFYTGMCRFLHKAMGKFSNIRHQWDLVNCGRYCSTSRDWNPSIDQTLWTSLLNKYSHCKVFIIALGLEDSIHKIDAYQTVENVKSVWQLLNSLHKEVLICTIPICSSSDSQLYTDLFSTNKMIKDWADSSDVPVHVIDLGVWEDQFFCIDKRHLSSNGYKRAAGLFERHLELAMTRSEFAVTKRMLTSTVRGNNTLDD